ncbi:MAG: hypothetical protein OK456_00210 [Thaumarchaeota archaeon]|nr:hypothetical protein [Nitrososphaerota archaeon]
MKTRNIYGLMVIVSVAWLLIVAESYFFVAVIRPEGPNLHGGPIPSTVLKLMLTAGLGLLWVGVMFALDTFYTRSRLTPTSAS